VGKKEFANFPLSATIYIILRQIGSFLYYSLHLKNLDLAARDRIDIISLLEPFKTTTVILKVIAISNVTNPMTITDLETGTTYYFVVIVEDDSRQSRKSKEISHTVVNTEASIQLGDILSHSETNAAVSEFENVPKASLSDSKSATKPEPQGRQVASTQSSTEAIICFGDSLTFGTGASKGIDYPSQLAKMIGNPVINKGIPGDTTASALRRLNRNVLPKAFPLISEHSSATSVFHPTYSKY
jgi:hypothetical protein